MDADHDQPDLVVRLVRRRRRAVAFHTWLSGKGSAVLKPPTGDREPGAGAAILRRPGARRGRVIGDFHRDDSPVRVFPTASANTSDAAAAAVVDPSRLRDSSRPHPTRQTPTALRAHRVGGLRTVQPAQRSRDDRPDRLRPTELALLASGCNLSPEATQVSAQKDTFCRSPKATIFLTSRSASRSQPTEPSPHGTELTGAFATREYRRAHGPRDAELQSTVMTMPPQAHGEDARSGCIARCVRRYPRPTNGRRWVDDGLTRSSAAWRSRLSTPRSRPSQASRRERAGVPSGVVPLDGAR